MKIDKEISREILKEFPTLEHNSIWKNSAGDYTVFGKYSIHTTAFTLAYIKQVEGVNCSGGVCRLEPAFSGVRFTLTTNF